APCHTPLLAWHTHTHGNGRGRTPEDIPNRDEYGFWLSPLSSRSLLWRGPKKAVLPIARQHQLRRLQVARAQRRDQVGMVAHGRHAIGGAPERTLDAPYLVFQLAQQGDQLLVAANGNEAVVQRVIRCPGGTWVTAP